MKGQLFSHLSNVSNCSNLEAAIGKYSRFFFYFQNLSFSFSTIWRNDRKVLYNFQAEMKQRAIILPSFELEQFGVSAIEKYPRFFLHGLENEPKWQKSTL